MTCSQPELKYSPKGLGKLIRHSGAVYPLEAYGILIGEKNSNTLVAALPVSKTARWHDFTDRFALIEEALPSAVEVAQLFRLEVLGVYHSFYNFCCASPIHDVPERFRGSIVCIKDVSGGELDLFSYRFYFGGKEVHARKAPPSYSPDRNPRRIHSSWISHWGLIDYDNGYVLQPTADEVGQPSHDTESSPPHDNPTFHARS